MRLAVKWWLILGGIHLVLWPLLLFGAFHRVDLRHVAVVCLFTVPLAQAIALSSVSRDEPWLRLGPPSARLLLLVDALLCAAVLFGLDPRAIAAALGVKALLLGARKRLLLAAAAAVTAAHVAVNLSDVATPWLGIRSDAVRWMIAFSALNALLLIVLLHDRTTGAAPLFAMLGYAMVICSYFLHPFLAGPWLALAPTAYSMAFTFAMAGETRSGAPA